MTLRFPKWVLYLSDRLDGLFPGPTNEQVLTKLQQQQAEVEATATNIRNNIQHCTTVQQCINLEAMVWDLTTLYGDTTQVCGWHNSLMLEIHNRKILISK